MFIPGAMVGTQCCCELFLITFILYNLIVMEMQIVLFQS